MDLRNNADRFTGAEYVQIYHKHRPVPPSSILQQSLNYLNKEKAKNIADLGAGTGIATFQWASYAKNVFGIEPSAGMIEIARENNSYEHIKFIQAFAHDTGLEEGSLDIVSCSQSFHWMEPNSTLKEVSRVLKPKGVLVIFDVVWPPTANADLELAYRQLFEQVDFVTKSKNHEKALKFPKDKHLENIINSGYFDFCKETYFHESVDWDLDRFKGIAISQGGLEALLKQGLTPGEIGLSQFENTIKDLAAPISNKLTFNYKVIFARKK